MTHRLLMKHCSQSTGAYARLLEGVMRPRSCVCTGRLAVFPLICSVLMTCAVGATGTAPAPQPHETASQAQPTQTAPAVRPIDTFPDTWAASDALGRRVV